tara:strand:- start:1499 stop:2098 length:600 start_codon:yes stop_codon:yes gene_type:complete
MSPEKNLELELKKLEVEQQIEMYRIQKQNENDAKKAAGLHEAVQMIGGAIESIGKSVASSLIQANSGGAPAPASMQMSPPPPVENYINYGGQPEPDAVVEDDGSNPLVGQLECPDCGQNAVYITQDLYDRNMNGETIHVACVACGEQHTMGGDEENELPPETVGTPPPAFSQPENGTVPNGTTSDGKERPPRRNFVSID